MVFYFYGDNSYVISRQIESIKAQYIAKTGSDLDMETFDMSERPLSNLLNSLAVVPMFVTSRLLIVRELGTHKLTKDKLEKLLASIPDSTNVVLVDTSVDKRSVHYKTLSGIKNARSLGSLSPHQLVGWIKSEVEKLGGSIDNSTINVLIDRVGNDQWQLASEIAKLCAYDDAITLESIDELVVPNLTQTAFMMTDAIVRGDAKKATELYHRLTHSGEADQKILGAIVYQYRVLVLAKDNEGKGGRWQKEQGISPYAASKAVNIVRSLTLEQLKSAYQNIIDYDFSVKTGEVESRAGMEMLLYKLSIL